MLCSDLEPGVCLDLHHVLKVKGTATVIWHLVQFPPFLSGSFLCEAALYETFLIGDKGLG